MEEIKEQPTQQQEDPDEAKSYGFTYFIVSLLTLLVTLWAVWDEAVTRRPWKSYQQTFNRMETEKTKAALEKAQAKIDGYAQSNDPIPGLTNAEGKPVQITYNELMVKLNEAENRLQTQEYQTAEEEVRRLQNKLKFGPEQEIQFAKSIEEEVFFEYKETKKKGGDYAELEKEVKELQAEQASYQPERDRVIQELDAAQKKVADMAQEAKYYQKLREAVYAEVDDLQRKLKGIKGRWPEIKQVVIEGYRKTNFREPFLIADRCHSCHLGIDQAGFEDAPQPYRSHPNREVFLGNHPVNKFGCTFCHKGQGEALDSVEDAHGSHHLMDQTPGQNEPLLEGAELQSSCRKCHPQEVNLDGAPVLSKGRRIFEEVGCFGCHTTKGYEALDKVGPDLTRIATKTTPDWALRWIKNPKDYLPHTRMPDFLLKDEEAEAITAYLWDSSEKEAPSPVDLGFPEEGPIPTEMIEQGKTLIEKVGCNGCHSVGERKIQVSDQLVRDFGPDLTRVASKVNAQWLYRWVKNPQDYFPKTRMPNLRLTDEEAKAVVAYLMSLSRKEEVADLEKRIKDSMKIVEGERLIANYGCFGCHEIKGMEGRSKIGVELTTYGEKRVLELEFGYITNIKETWSAWTFAKLKDPRQFTTERVIQRMPNFSFSDEEAAALKVFLQSLTGEAQQIPTRFTKPMDEMDLNREEGRRLVRQYNCVGCHILEGKGGSIAAFYENSTFAPPNLATEGEKVQTPWLYKFIQQPTPIRPWLDVRMPTFGFSDEKTNLVVNYFLSLAKKEDRIRYVFVDEHTLPEENLMAAQVLVSRDYLDCFNCHQQGKVKPQGPPEGWAPDLDLARSRLNPAWIVKWLKDPQYIMPGTRMPAFFSDEESGPPDILDGDEIKQIKALSDYLMLLGKES